jgi:hypothetical protein
MTNAAPTATPRGVFRKVWPAAAGAAVAVATALGETSSADFAPIVTASGFVYLGAASLQKRTSDWPFFLLSFVIVTAGFMVPGIDASWLMIVIALGLAAFGLSRGAIRPRWGLPLQALAMVAFAGTALVAVQINETLGGVLVAVGLFAHAVWDVAHHRADRVVTRSVAEFCFVLDTVLAILALVIVLR